MENFTDPSLMSLPHPVRVDVAAGYPVDTALFEHVGIMATLRPYLTDEHATTEWIVNHVPGMHELAMAHFGVLAGGNMGSFMLTVPAPGCGRMATPSYRSRRPCRRC